MMLRIEAGESSKRLDLKSVREETGRPVSTCTRMISFRIVRVRASRDFMTFSGTLTTRVPADIMHEESSDEGSVLILRRSGPKGALGFEILGRRSRSERTRPKAQTPVSVDCLRGDGHRR